MSEPAVVQTESRPLVVPARGVAVVEWCVWVTRTHYSDGSVREEYHTSRPAQRIREGA